MGVHLVTGATGAIGRVVAAVLRERGHDLLLTGRSSERLTLLAGELGGATHGATQVISRDQAAATAAAAGRRGTARIGTIPLDLAEPRRLEAALAEYSLPPRLDGIVHCAGMADIGPVADQDIDHWIDQLMVNLVAAAELTRLLLPALRAAEGHVVFVNSGSGLRARPNWSAYAASKFGLRALADSLRDEEPSLRVTSVYPGRTAGEMQRRIRAQEGGDYDPAAYIDPLTVAKAIVNALETPRDATITDVSIRR